MGPHPVADIVSSSSWSLQIHCCQAALPSVVHLPDLLPAPQMLDHFAAVLHLFVLHLFVLLSSVMHLPDLLSAAPSASVLQFPKIPFCCGAILCARVQLAQRSVVVFFKEVP